MCAASLRKSRAPQRIEQLATINLYNLQLYNLQRTTKMRTKMRPLCTLQPTYTFSHCASAANLRGMFLFCGTLHTAPIEAYLQQVSKVDEQKRLLPFSDDQVDCRSGYVGHQAAFCEALLQG